MLALSTTGGTARRHWPSTRNPPSLDRQRVGARWPGDADKGHRARDGGPLSLAGLAGLAGAGAAGGAGGAGGAGAAAGARHAVGRRGRALVRRYGPSTDRAGRGAGWRAGPGRATPTAATGRRSSGAAGALPVACRHDERHNGRTPPQWGAATPRAGTATASAPLAPLAPPRHPRHRAGADRQGDGAGAVRGRPAGPGAAPLRRPRPRHGDGPRHDDGPRPDAAGTATATAGTAAV